VPLIVLAHPTQHTANAAAAITAITFRMTTPSDLCLPIMRTSVRTLKPASR